MAFTEENNFSECLSDIGICEKESTEILDAYSKNSLPEVLELLKKHKKAILCESHKLEKQIDCLDYLIYRFEKEIGTNTERR